MSHFTSFDVAPEEFGAFARQIFTLAQAKVFALQNVDEGLLT
jgi:hypothetical protein